MVYAEGLWELGERVIHVVPTRCLVEELVSSANKSLGVVKAAGQCSRFTPSLKDPYLLNPIVYSTIDSYALNFFKVPVAERQLIALGKNLGHYEIPRYAAFSSVNVFDEYHLLAPGDEEISGEDNGSKASYECNAWTTLTMIIKELIGGGVFTVLETATPNINALTKLREEFNPEDCYTIAYDASLPYGRHSEGQLEIINDDEFTNSMLNRKYETIVREASFKDYACDKALELSKSMNVLIACNTVDEAISIYESLKSKTSSIALIHSRFTFRDRERKLKRMRKLIKRGASIIISTQVIEVGVNLDFDAIISNAAPLVSIVQRVGRVARRLDRSGKFEVHIIYDSKCECKEREPPTYSAVYPLKLTKVSFEVIKKAAEKGISWRLPSSKPIDGLKPYNRMAEEVYRVATVKNNLELLRILRLILHPATSGREAESQIAKLVSLVRDTVELPVSLPSSSLRTLPHMNIIPVRSSILGIHIRKLKDGLEILIDEKRAAEVLEFFDGRVKALVELLSSDGEELTEEWLDKRQLADAITRGLVRVGREKAFFHYLIIKPEAYSSELGLRVCPS